MNLWQQFRASTALALIAFAIAPHCLADNLWQEKQWQEHLVAVIPAEQIVWLETPGQPTLALYKQTAHADIQGGIILVPPPGTHPDNEQVISPLRNGLPDFGWSTLSIQPPSISGISNTTELAPLMDEFEPRLLLAINFFKERNIQNIVLMGYGLGATLSAGFLIKNTTIDTDITAFVSISMVKLISEPSWSDVTVSLSQMKIPVFDVYAEFDLPEAVSYSEERLRAARIAGRQINKPAATGFTPKVQRLAHNKTGNLNFRQKEIPGADPIYTDKQQELLKVIRGWLKNYAAGIEIPVK